MVIKIVVIVLKKLLIFCIVNVEMFLMMVFNELIILLFVVLSCFLNCVKSGLFNIFCDF